ncbi:hypothetical protein [Candidatus Manganitrophus noduliformans]|uniref:Uncharacterized protein n=1 Tax=Candidatus Manganitrophus noduliformans TaxID=2606439 RepID=A0A7X6DRS7_9BACT|nr:hypothetical protein [Candidatus Manganitrophus noduliformans]NKE72170.1 hypothetical protein [Candidatus Manganitrophus noduliformans]
MKIIVLGILLVLCAIPDKGRAGDMFNYGRYWSQLPPIARSAYVEGIVDGGSHAYFQAASEWLPPGEIIKKPEPEKVGIVRKKVFIMVDPNTIISVITDLYKDPANTFIDTVDMLYIARDKLLGEKIDDRLVSARKKAVESNEQLKVFERDK